MRWRGRRGEGMGMLLTRQRWSRQILRKPRCSSSTDWLARGEVVEFDLPLLPISTLVRVRFTRR